MATPDVDTKNQDEFASKVARLREDYHRRRDETNLVPPAGKRVLDATSTRVGKPSVIYWYQDGTDLGQCVRIYDIPGSLSGDILRLHRNLPAVSGHFEIEGDIVRPLDRCLDRPIPIADDFEDVSDLVAQLPLVTVNSAVHFTKKGKYRSEIKNLHACQSGSCPGTPLSPHLVRLLGRSREGELVFEKLWPRYVTLPRFFDLGTYKSWLLQIISALDTLHSLGIIHRDLRIENLLFSQDGKHLVICDLEGHWGQRAAPEVARKGLDAGWSAKSDIYDLGNCIKCMVYANAPITRQVEWPVPEPLEAIVEACMRVEPEHRPTLQELRAMLENIKCEADGCDS
ncbi:kinase-like domain-containing protein [Nemania sp. FL0031]|nr:kinase-like domain-containing protein [Nemania sp. FL0031]